MYQVDVSAAHISQNVTMYISLIEQMTVDPLVPQEGIIESFMYELCFPFTIYLSAGSSQKIFSSMVIMSSFTKPKIKMSSV